MAGSSTGRKSCRVIVFHWRQRELGCVWRNLDSLQLADPRQPGSCGNPLMQHRSVHQQQRRDGAAVRAVLARGAGLLIQPEVRVKSTGKLILFEAAPRLRNDFLKGVDAALRLVPAKPGLLQQVDENPHFVGFGSR